MNVQMVGGGKRKREMRLFSSLPVPVSISWLVVVGCA